MLSHLWCVYIYIYIIDIVTLLCFPVQKLSFGKIGFSKAMSNKWIRVDKAHEGGPRIFRTVCDKFYLLSWLLLSAFPALNKGVLVMCWSPGGEDWRPGQREAASGKERRHDSAGGERKEWAEEEKAALWGVSPQTVTHNRWLCPLFCQ